jgi:hypothetical protein
MMMTEDDGSTRAPAKASRHRRLWTWAIVLGTPVLLFFAVSLSVNETRIPTELKQLPPDWAGTSSPAQTGVAPDDAAPPAGDPAHEFAFPAAHRTRADGAVTLPSPTKDNFWLSYNAFLEAELRERPELEGARLYLEISRQFRTTETGEELRQVVWGGSGQGDAPRHVGPLPQEQTEWLVSHADMVHALLRFAESSGLPLRTREAVAADAKPLEMPGPDPLLLRLGSRVLSAEGRRRMEAGNEAGALRLWRAAIRVAVQQNREPIEILPLIGAGTLDAVVQTLSAWVGGGDASPEGLADLRPTLAEVHSVVFRPGWVAEEMQMTYPIRRRELVAECDRQPWRSRLFGWVADDPSRDEEFHFDLHFPKIKRLPNVLAFAWNAQLAMRNKRETPRLLSEMDKSEREAIRRSLMTWPEVSSADKWDWPQDNPFLDRVAGFDPANAIAFMLRKEARLNLLRSAIEWRLAPPDAKPDPAAMTIEGRESPWRDPFAEAPFHATVLPSGDDGDDSNHAGGGVLLYSLGPDLQDQQGQIEYDPSNGTVSAGDLTVKVEAKR